MIILLNVGLEEKREALRAILEVENNIMECRSTVGRLAMIRATAQLLMENAYPCGLHADNRVGERLYYCIFVYAIRRYGEAKKDVSLRNRLIKDITATMKVELGVNGERALHISYF